MWFCRSPLGYLGVLLFAASSNLAQSNVPTTYDPEYQFNTNYEGVSGFIPLTTGWSIPNSTNISTSSPMQAISVQFFGFNCTIFAVHSAYGTSDLTAYTDFEVIIDGTLASRPQYSLWPNVSLGMVEGGNEFLRIDGLVDAWHNVTITTSSSFDTTLSITHVSWWMNVMFRKR